MFLSDAQHNALFRRPMQSHSSRSSRSLFTTTMTRFPNFCQFYRVHVTSLLRDMFYDAYYSAWVYRINHTRDWHKNVSENRIHCIAQLLLPHTSPQVFNDRLKNMVVIVKSVSDIIMMHIYLFFDTYRSTEGDKLTRTCNQFFLSRNIYIYARNRQSPRTHNRNLDIYMPCLIFLHRLYSLHCLEALSSRYVDEKETSLCWQEQKKKR